MVVTGLVVVVGLVVVAGRVVTLDGVTTVRVTVPFGLVVVVVGLEIIAGPSVLEVETFVVVVGLVMVLSLDDAGLAEISVGLFKPEASVREPVIVGEVGFAGEIEVELLLPPLLKELPAPVVPPARLS